MPLEDVGSLGRRLLAAVGRHESLPRIAHPIVLACSGGRDSMALLEIATQVLPRAMLRVAHVHHGLVDQADAWLAFCRTQAEERGVEFVAVRLATDPAFGPDGAPDAQARRFDGLGLEAWARRGRYRALTAIAAASGARLVLTAHHRLDQFETHRLQARRGAGDRGLAAMPPDRSLREQGEAGRGVRLLRPFLEVGRDSLERVLRLAGRGWIEDPSNHDPRRARTAVRHELLGELAADRALASALLGRIATHRVAASLAARDAREDLDRCLADPGSGAMPRAELRGRYPHQAPALSQRALRGLALPRRHDLLRHWLDVAALPMPSRAVLAEIDKQLVDGAASRGRVRHAGVWLLRHRDRIGLASALPEAVVPGAIVVPPPSGPIVIGTPWPGARALETVIALPVGPDGRLPATLHLDRARGEERLRLRRHGPSRSWKHLCQSARVPVWLRDALPLLRLAPDGAAVYAAPFGALAPLAGESTDRAMQATPAAPAKDGASCVVRWYCPHEWSGWLPLGGGEREQAQVATL